MAWEIGDADEFVNQRMETDEELRSLLGSDFCFNMKPGKTKRTIFIVFQMIGGADTPGQAGRRLMARPRYQIKTYTLGMPTTESERVVNRVDELFQTKGRLTTPNGRWRVSSRRATPISGEEAGPTADDFYIYRGGIYLFSVSPALVR
jgi:hypothetical protein